ncbi:MAG TPA: hypothetical protein PLJ71_14975 [Candidatus Hydrogenedentes bacterium]|nr:hypothetical protein [Candidatus Hydrogenedentota bacterium]HQM49990.1 hypothetical protein [Candidatus Hydrogenedentota bacterium]
MKTQIEKILQAEQDARDRVAAAEGKAREIAAAAAAEASRITAEYREKARAEAQESLENARAEAEREKQLIIQQARDEAGQITGGQWAGDSSRVDQAARSLAGLS